MGAWTVGSNPVGYMPVSDVFCVSDRQYAGDILTDNMMDFAHEDDTQAWEWLTELHDSMGELEDDEYPTVEDHVHTLLYDGHPNSEYFANSDYSVILVDNDGMQHSFWVIWDPDNDPVDDDM